MENSEDDELLRENSEEDNALPINELNYNNDE